MSNKTRDLSRTAAAIEAYDLAVRDADLADMRVQDAIGGEEYWMLWRAWDVFDNEVKRRAEAVGVAFGEDTKDINNSLTCRECIRPEPKVPPPGAEESFVRKMVRLWKEENEKESERTRKNEETEA